VCLSQAISEPNFSVAYANMAKCMLNVSVSSVLHYSNPGGSFAIFEPCNHKKRWQQCIVVCPNAECGSQMTCLSQTAVVDIPDILDLL